MKNIFYIIYFFSNLVSSQNFLVENIPPALLENANSVMVEEKVNVYINSLKEIETTYHAVITVLNKNGDFHLLPVVYYDNEVKVKNVELFIYDKNGEQIEKFKKRDFIDISAVSGGTLYSENRALVLDYTPKSYPYTIEFNYNTITEDTAFIPPFLPITNFNNSVQSSEYAIHIPKELKLKYKVFDVNDAIRVTTLDNFYGFKVTNLNAFLEENHSPNFKDYLPQVLFSLNEFYLKGIKGSSEDWEQFGVWMNNRLLQGVSDIPEGTKNKIQNLVAEEPSTIERAKKVYQYLQENTRYISVQIGIGGWKPMKASEVDRLGYGDCKALANYTKALLSIADVPSYYTVVYGGVDKRNIYSDFASMQGNHIILAIPNENDYIWLECTSQQTPFGFLGDFTDDRDVLLITPEGGKIAHTKKYEFEENKLITKANVTLSQNGSISVNAELVSYGIQYDKRFLIETKDNDDKKKFYKEYWDYIDNIVLNSMEFSNDKEKIEFKETIKFEASSYSSSAGEKMIVNLNVLNRSTFIPKRYKDRNLPLQISRGYTDEDTVTIILPKDVTVSTLPKPLTLESEFGSYFSKLEALPDGNLLYTRKLQIKDGLFPKESYDDFRNFRKEIAKNDTQKIILIKK